MTTQIAAPADAHSLPIPLSLEIGSLLELLHEEMTGEVETPAAWPVVVSEIQRRHEVVESALDELPRLRKEVSRLTTAAKACDQLNRLEAADRTAHALMVSFLAQLERLGTERQEAFMKGMREIFAPRQA